MNGEATTPSRLCITCYKRKLKCDRQSPCSRCKVRGAPCSYPDNKITRNRPKACSPQKEGDARQQFIRIKDSKTGIVKLYEVEGGLAFDAECQFIIDSKGNKRALSPVGQIDARDVNQELPLTPLSQEEILVEHEEESPMTPFTLSTLLSSMSGEQREVEGLYVPTPNDLERYWTVFCRNVDPIVRFLHKPSVRRLIDTYSLHGVSRCGPAAYALIMSIVFSAANSLPPDGEIERMFGEDRNVHITKIKAATEIALSRADLASTNDLVALQAFTLFLVTRVADHNSVEIWLTLWCQISLAMRMAASMNIHKDGSTLGLSPFDAEMRRRLWWHLFPTAVRTSEKFSCDPYTYGGGIVSMPMNLDDERMDPDSHEPLLAQTGVTEMTACIIRCEAANAVMKAVLKYDPPPCSMLTPGLSSQDKIRHFQQVLQAKYLDDAEARPEEPRSRLILHMGQIVILKMCWVWGIAMMRKQGNFQPISGRTGALNASAANISEALFITATKTLKAQLNQQEDSAFRNWQWILLNFNSWHAIAVILTQLLSRIKALPFRERRLELLAPAIRDAWAVSELGFRRTDPWSMQKQVVGPLVKMRKEIQVMIGVDDDDIGERREAAVGKMAMQALYRENAVSQEMEMDIDSLPPLQTFGGDPWPLFIPTSFL